MIRADKICSQIFMFSLIKSSLYTDTENNYMKLTIISI